MPMIEIRDVSKWYGSFQVLADCTTNVEKGEVIVVCGPSGSGKSTLIKTVNALEPIQKGDIHVDGVHVNDPKTKLPKLRARVGMVFQHFELFPHLTVRENLSLGQVKVLGRTPREWCSLARPVLRPLLEAAQQIGMLELVGALLAFDAALERAAGESSATLSERSTETLKTVYQGLCRLLPTVFTVTSESGGPGRQTVLLESLLLQIPELHRRSLAKLYAAGLSSLAQLTQARADELAAVTGLDVPLAERLIAHVKTFEEARTRVLPTEQKSRAVERLRSVVERLRQLQADFEQAERDEQSDKKRNARRGREAALHELDQVLAEIGEIAVIEELKRCPVQLKIQRVSTYLKEAQASL